MEAPTIVILFLAVVFAGGFGCGRFIEGRETRNAIEQCEATLPRNQHCVITAVPEHGDDPND